jgi:hypothetical protein
MTTGENDVPAKLFSRGPLSDSYGRKPGHDTMGRAADFHLIVAPTGNHRPAHTGRREKGKTAASINRLLNCAVHYAGPRFPLGAPPVKPEPTYR